MSLDNKHTRQSGLDLFIRFSPVHLCLALTYVLGPGITPRVPTVRTSGTALGQELPPVEGSPIARKFGIPDHLVTFQVMRRTLGTDLQEHGTLKDAQGALRHASIRTTGDVYMQTIESSVLHAMNSRTMQILAGWEHPVMTELDELDQTQLEGLTSGVLKQLDQRGPSLEGREEVSC